MDILKIKLKKLDDRAVIPTYAHDGDVGMDMTAIDVEYDDSKDMYIYHTGLSFESDFNVGQFLFARSSNRKTDAYLCNGVGIADSAIYRGEILFCFKNRDSIHTIARLNALEKILMNNISDPIAKDGIFRTTMAETLEKARNLEFAPYSVGDRIGQMVFMNYPTVEIAVVDDLSKSERGAKGFGSSGN